MSRSGQNDWMIKVTPRFKRQKGDHPGHYIRQWRKFRGYTQEQLAERIGVTHGAVSQLETGKVKYTQPMLEAVAEALMTEPAAILNVDPLSERKMWSLWELAKPGQKRQIEAIVEAILKNGTDG